MTTCASEDGEQLQLLSEEFRIAWHAPISWRSTVAEFKACSLIITNRLHGLILGTLAETPLLLVANRKKPEAFVSDVNIPHHVKRMSELNNNLLNKVDADRSLILQRIEEFRKKSSYLSSSPFG